MVVQIGITSKVSKLMKTNSLLFFSLAALSASAAFQVDRSAMSDQYWAIWNDAVQAKIDADIERYRKADAAVLAACETIRTRACCGLTAREVVDAFPCKRRMAELRFRAATGQSILEAIRAERRATAERLLRDGQLTSDLVAAQCGYSTPSSVYRLLHA